MRRLDASLILLVLVSGLAPAAEGYPDANTYQYKTVGDTNLSLHVFNPEGHKPTDSRPAAVFFFFCHGAVGPRDGSAGRVILTRLVTFCCFALGKKPTPPPPARPAPKKPNTSLRDKIHVSM